MSHRFTIEDRIQMVREYYTCGSYAASARSFPKKGRPSENSVKYNVDKFESTGSVADYFPEETTKRTRTEAFIENVEDSIEKKPRLSIRARSAEMNIPYTTLQRTIKELGFHAYRPHLLNDLTQAQKTARYHFSCTMLGMPNFPDEILPFIWFSDECRFGLDGVVNKHNCVYYSRSNPFFSITQRHTKKSVHVWCAISSIGIIGPYFFEENVDAEVYMEMLGHYFLPQVMTREEDADVWFQQDGASPHYAAKTLRFLSDHFGDQLISRGGPIPWPARSPDLSPLDFFLWGFLKEKVYATMPQDIDELKDEIENAVARIPLRMINSAVEAFVDRLNDCIESNGEQV